jgi:exonuclease SbcD
MPLLMRILHTADWHLGRLLHQVSLLEDQRFALDQILSLIESQRVDVLVIAGDVYDRAVPPADAVELLDGFIDKVSTQLRVPVVMIAGNHDSVSRLGFGARQLAKAGIYIFQPAADPEPVVLNDEHGEVAFYGFPYLEPVQVRELSGDMSVRTHEHAAALLTGRALEHNGESRRSVGVAHCFVSGGEVCDSERPLSVGGTDQVSADHFKGFSYTALGHLHQPQQQGAAHVRYSGSLAKYSFSEAKHHKSVTLIEMDAQGACTLELLPLKPRRDLRIIQGELETLLANPPSDDNAADYLLVRLDDEHALLDVMSRLRAVYPNVLQIVRPGLLNRGVDRVEHSESLKREELPLFADFFEQMRGEALNDEQRQVLSEALEQLRQDDR